MLICKNADNTVRWKSGERLSHYFEQRVAALLEIMTEPLARFPADGVVGILANQHLALIPRLCGALHAIAEATGTRTPCEASDQVTGRSAASSPRPREDSTLIGGSLQGSGARRARAPVFCQAAVTA